MTHALTLCDHCHRHIRANESACPFCHGARPAASRLALAAAVGAVVVGALAGDAQAQRVPPRRTIEHMPAQAYGAPPWDPLSPMFDPVTQPVAPPPPAPPPAVAPPARVDATVSVAVSGADPRTAASLRSAARRSLDAIRACGERAVGRVREVRRDVVVTWGASNAPPAQRDPVDRCVAAAVRDALPAAPAGRRARITVRVRFARAGLGAEGRGDLCAGFTQPGCRRTGCPGGMVCDARVSCVPSSCGCDPATGQQTCTDDCGGGVCVPAGSQRPAP